MKKVFVIIISILSIALAITSCKDAGNDYLISYGIGDNIQQFAGTPEEVDSLDEVAYHIMEAVDNIYRQELSTLSSETDSGAVIFRGTGREEVLTQINEALKKVDQQLDNITIISGLYFEYNVQLTPLDGDNISKVDIYNRKFGEKPNNEE